MMSRRPFQRGDAKKSASRAVTEISSRPPSLFISHGAPNILLYPSETRSFWEDLGAKWPRPSAVLIMSAHFPAARATFEMDAHPGMIHDFGGFEPELYRMTFPAPGAPALAQKASDLARAAGLDAAPSQGRGYDHGAWVPLKVIFADADIPVATVSVQPRENGAHHLALGRALAPLRDQGVLIVGSGGATHNLRAFFGGEDTPLWARTFNDWLCEKIEAGDADAVAAWEQGPEALRNHPTPEHFLPLPFAFGAGGPGARGKRLHHAFIGPISLDAYGFE
jgi:4,5-DOPA dioxygenase extradiol